jgi:beta-fructofuranosidase
VRFPRGEGRARQQCLEQGKHALSIFRRPTTAAAAGDPIPFFWNGETHLFYLSSPSGTTDYPDRVRTTWQHAVTSDMRNWRELAPAVVPGDAGTVDGGGIWTGSVVEHQGRFYLFYTGHHVGDTYPQSICLATSDDLVTFVRSPLNPLSVAPENFEPVDWRDPYVFFNEEEDCWWMLIAARRSAGPKWRRGCIALATSKDLLHWNVEKEPLYEPGTTYCPECPELWQMGSKWYLVFSRFSEDAGTIYRVADSPRGPFRVLPSDALGGRRWYAAKSAPQPDGTRVFFGWVHDAVKIGKSLRWLWGGDFAAPRVVSASLDGSLEVKLHPEVVRQFEPSVLEEKGLSALGTAQYEKVGGPIAPRNLIEFQFTHKDHPSEFGVALVRNDDLEGWFVTFNRNSKTVCLTREPRPLDDFWADLTARVEKHREVDGAVVASATFNASSSTQSGVILIDGEVLEISINGSSVITHRIEREAEQTPVAFCVDGVTSVSWHSLDHIADLKR